MSASAAARHVRRIRFRFQSTDARRYALSETIRRAAAAVVRAGGTPVGGVSAAPPHIRRWCVLRSPHVNKTSREHFWMKTHRRSFVWDAAPGVVPAGAEIEIAELLPGNVATRVVVDAPALSRLRAVWDTMQSVKGLPDAESIAGSGGAEPAVSAATRKRRRVN
jgi:small subunit ribosomal protein S10